MPYEKLGKSEEAHAWLREALSDAEPDGLVMPFVENYDILKPLLEREIKNDLISKIIELGEAAAARNAAGTRPAAFDVLTPREFEIVELMAQRLSNREIAEQLYLSEGASSSMSIRFIPSFISRATPEPNENSLPSCSDKRPNLWLMVIP